MPPKQLRLKIMYVEPAPESSDSDDEGSLTLVMSEFKKQMEEIERASKAIDTQITNLYSRVKEESVDWMNEPLVPRPPLKAWLKAKGYPPHPTVEEFLDICYASAKTMDLESRVVCFHKDDAAALWNGQRRLTVFDIVGLIPTLFE